MVHNIGLLNLGSGNLKSIIQILKNIDLNIKLYLVNSNFKDIKNIDRIIMPGQGLNYFVIKFLLNNKFKQLFKFIAQKPVLGICVSKQIFFNFCEEFNTKNLSLFSGIIKSFSTNNFIYKKPNIGWKKVHFLKNHYLFKKIKNFSNFYFSHSYFLNNFNTDNTFGLTKYKIFFSSIFIKNNICLLQFHPEKSNFQGFNFFRNFCNWNV